jgi:hypothetical protein
VKTLTLLAAVLVTGTLGAQSSAALSEKRVQIFGEFSRPRQFILAQPNGDVKDQAAAQTGLGLRFMAELPRTSNWFFEFGGKLESSSRLGFKQTVPMASPNPAISINSTDVAIHYSYWEIGGAYLWDLSGGFAFGAHLDLRSETLSAQGQLTVLPATYTGGGTVDQRATLMRPWVRFSGDYTFKAGGTSPFFGADVAFTPIRSSQNAVVPFVGLDDRTMKAMAPQFAASLYLGLRF